MLRMLAIPFLLMAAQTAHAGANSSQYHWTTAAQCQSDEKFRAANEKLCAPFVREKGGAGD